MMKKMFGLASVLVLMIVAMAVSVAANPLLSGIGAKSVNEGSRLSFLITSTAADNPASSPTAFRICSVVSPAVNCIGTAPNANGFSSLAIGATTANITNLSNTQAQFNWTPDFTQSGTYTIRFNASDADSSTAENVVITVADVPPSFTVTSLSLGSKSQDRSNPKADDEKDFNVNVSGIVTITNTGGETIKNLKFDRVTGLSKYSSSFANVNSNSVSLAATELAPGASTTATVILRVPENLDAINSNGDHVAFDVAQLTFSGTKSDGVALSPVTSSVSMMAENNLKFNLGKLLFDSKSEKIDDGDTVKDIKPGMVIELELELESKLKDKDDLDIEDIVVTVESTGDTDDLDVDEEDEIDAIGPEETATSTISFDVEDDALKGKESMVISLEGVDENGAKHGETWELTLDITREDHEIGIKSATLIPSSLSCEASAELSVSIRNTGRRDEDKVYLRVYSTELNFNSNVEIGSLDSNDEETRTFTLPVAVDAASGTYRVNIETYYNVGTKSDTDAKVLAKQACEKAQPPKKEEKGPIVVVPLPDNGIVKTPTPEVVTPAPEPKKGFLDSKAFIAVLILGYVAVLGGGSIVLIKLLRK